MRHQKMSWRKYLTSRRVWLCNPLPIPEYRLLLLYQHNLAPDSFSGAGFWRVSWERKTLPNNIQLIEINESVHYFFEKTLIVKRFRRGRTAVTFSQPSQGDFFPKLRLFGQWTLAVK